MDSCVRAGEQTPAGARRGLVERPRIVERLRGAESQLSLIVAPAGYGKTTVVREWAAADYRPFARLSIDETHDDPAVLWRDLVRAIDGAAALGADRVAALDVGAPHVWSVALPRLRRYLLQIGNPFVLVLDDVPERPPPLLSDMVSLIMSIAPGNGCVLVGEHVPALSGRLRRWTQPAVDRDTLVMTAEETDVVFAANDARLSPAEIAAVLERTGGWPIAVRLAAAVAGADRIAMRRVGEWPDDAHLVLRSLIERLLAQQADDVERFVVRTSILRELSGPACSAVLDDVGARDQLATVVGSGAFPVESGNAPGTYRHHALVAALLRERLTATEPDVEPQLHRRAGAWSIAHGELGAAVAHFHAAGDLARAARVVWQAVPALLPFGRRQTMERWLSGFTVDEIAGVPWLALSAAWCAVQAGHPPDGWITAAADAAKDIEDADTASSVRSSVALLRAGVAHHGIARMAADAELAYRLDGMQSPFRSVACLLAGAAHEMLGDSHAAKVWLEEGVRIAVLSDTPSIHAQCLAELAVIAAEDGDWPQVVALAHAAMTEVARYRLADTAAPIATVFVVATLASAHEGRVGDARRYRHDALRLLTAMRYVMPWVAAQARLCIARADLMTGDVAAAQVMVTEARHDIARFPDAAALFRKLADVSRLVDDSRPPTDAATALTTAEVRVLQYLPTHLSFDEIAARIEVSGRAVKADAIAIYRKLGVTSRAEAVERALVLGLVPPQDF